MAAINRPNVARLYQTSRDDALAAVGPPRSAAYIRVVCVERSLELGDERPQHAMVFAQEIEDFPRAPQASAKSHLAFWANAVPQPDMAISNQSPPYRSRRAARARRSSQLSSQRSSKRELL